VRTKIRGLNAIALGLLSVVIAIIMLYLSLVTIHGNFFVCSKIDPWSYCGITDEGVSPEFTSAFPLFIAGSIGFGGLGVWLFHKTKPPREENDSLDTA
jgi:hypothetical protein